MRTGLAASLIAVAALGTGAPAGAAPFGVQLGTDRLVVDAPAGFADSAAFGSPRLTELAESLADASSRVLVFALSDADTRRFAAGDSLELRRYVIAVTPRATERERMTAAQFAALVETLLRGLGTPPPANTDIMKYLRERPPQQAHLLAELRRDPQVLSVMQGTMVPQPGRWIDGEPVFKVSSMTVALIGGKALYLSAFSAYNGPADTEWVRTIAERWVEDLQRLNR
jgi:hypothetical protein